MTGTSAFPPGRSQSTCSATVGLAPVNAFTSAASANFSSIVVAAPPCTNFPNRVPVLEKPHDGTSIRNPSSALHTLFALRSAAPAPSIAIAPSSQHQNVQIEIYSLLKQASSSRVHHFAINCQS